MDELKTFFTNNAVGLLAVFFTPFLGWLFNRKKEQSETKKVDADAASIIANSGGQLAGSWQEFANEMKEQYNQCMQRTSALEENVKNVKNLNDVLSKGFQDLTIKNNSLKEYTGKLTDFIGKLIERMEKIDPSGAEVSKMELEELRSNYEKREVITNA